MLDPLSQQKIIKGVANRHRIRILLLVANQPGRNLSDIAGQLELSDRTASEHTRRLAVAGLLEKTYDHQNVIHTITPLGMRFVEFLKTI